MRSLFPILLCLAAFAGTVAGLAGCSDDGGDSIVDPGDGPPDPHDGQDEILFRVFVDDPAGGEDLRWVGDSFGPTDDSPETTDRPFVPFGRGFRVAWEADAAGAPVVGTRHRVYRSLSEYPLYFPIAGPDSVAYDTTSSFRFANDVAEASIDPASCGTGPFCYGDLRLDSGQVYLEIQSVNANGRSIDSLQTLRVEVNYPPRVDLAEVPPVPDAAAAFPAWTLALEGGGALENALADGDTIPSGALVRVLIRGRDRLAGASDPDSLCCDERLDDEVPEVRFQGQARASMQDEFPVPTLIDPNFGPVLPDSVLFVTVGPGAYEIEALSVDEHGRRSEGAILRFVAGFPPAAPRMEPVDGAEFVLLPPDEPVPMMDGRPAYTVVSQVRNFDADSGEWIFGEGLTQNGHVYRIPLRLESDPDPRVLGVDPELEGSFTDLPRAYSYELVSEYDPQNRLGQGASDRIDFFVSSNGLTELVLDDVDDERYAGFEVFVPDNLWNVPALYDSTLAGPSDPEPVEVLEAIADRVRRALGDYSYRARARTTDESSSFTQDPPLPSGVPAGDTGITVSGFADFGLRSPISEQSFSVRLRIETSAGTVLWPSGEPAP